MNNRQLALVPRAISSDFEASTYSCLFLLKIPQHMPGGVYLRNNYKFLSLYIYLCIICIYSIFVKGFFWKRRIFNFVLSTTNSNHKSNNLTCVQIYLSFIYSSNFVEKILIKYPKICIIALSVFHSFISFFILGKLTH